MSPESSPSSRRGPRHRRMSINLRETRPPLPVDRLLADRPPGPDALPSTWRSWVVDPPGWPPRSVWPRRRGRPARSSRSRSSKKRRSSGGTAFRGRWSTRVAFRQLFPAMEDQEFPFRDAGEPRERSFPYRATRDPGTDSPTMRNHGFFTASLSEIARWLGSRRRISGSRCFPVSRSARCSCGKTGCSDSKRCPPDCERTGLPGSGFEPPTEVAARVVILAEGARGPLGQAWIARLGISSPNPPIFALG